MTDPAPIAPRIEQRPALHLVGTVCDYAFADGDMLRALPLQWAAFGPLIPTVESGEAAVAFGVALPAEDSGYFRYMTAVPARSGVAPPRGMSAITLPAGSYLTFAHEGHVSTLNQTVAVACAGRKPASGAPAFLEYYGPGFDPETGLGDIEIWLPIAD
jgi:AraC family transcriptional regulator